MSDSNIARGRQRRGFLLVVLLICLFLVSATMVAVAKSVVAIHRLQGQQQLQLQAEQLATAGTERAAARLANQPEFEGETWTIPAAELDGTSAEVLVEIQAVANQPALRRVHVSALIGKEEGEAIRHSREIQIDLNTLGE